MKLPSSIPNAIAPNATVVGDVHIGAGGSSVFFGSVLQGDREPITIGEDTNIQDNCVLHQEYGCPTTVGSRVTVGHGAILHGCTIGDETLIGRARSCSTALSSAVTASSAPARWSPEHRHPRRLAGLRLARQGQGPAGRGRHHRHPPQRRGLPPGGCRLVS